MKLSSKKSMSILLMVLMLGSSITMGVSSLSQTEEKSSFPDDNVVDYVIDGTLRKSLISSGYTIIEYRYPATCSNCTDKISYIESAASSMPEQVFVQKIRDNSLSEPKLSMDSYYGSKNLDNPTVEQMFNAMCDILVSPPVVCVRN